MDMRQRPQWTSHKLLFTGNKALAERTAPTLATDPVIHIHTDTRASGVTHDSGMLWKH